ncbi:MAG: hypothetical protein AAFP76_00165 [Bacteroidota bacterium]
MNPNYASMKEIDPIYKNEIGLGFYWRRSGTSLKDKIQIIFRDTGFYLSHLEISEFYQQTIEALSRPRCTSCKTQECCRSILLRTPFSQVDLAVSTVELEGMEDLLSGILFHLNLRQYLNGLGLN